MPRPLAPDFYIFILYSFIVFSNRTKRKKVTWKWRRQCAMKTLISRIISDPRNFGIMRSIKLNLNVAYLQDMFFFFHVWSFRTLALRLHTKCRGHNATKIPQFRLSAFCGHSTETSTIDICNIYSFTVCEVS